MGATFLGCVTRTFINFGPRRRRELPALLSSRSVDSAGFAELVKNGYGHPFRRLADPAKPATYRDEIGASSPLLSANLRPSRGTNQVPNVPVVLLADVLQQFVAREEAV